MSSTDSSVGPAKRQKMEPLDGEQNKMETAETSPETCEMASEQLEGEPLKKEKVADDEEQENEHEAVKDSERPPKLVSCYDSDVSAELNESFDSDIDDAPANQQIETVRTPMGIEDEGSVSEDRKIPEKLTEPPADLSFDTPTTERFEQSKESESPPPRPGTALQNVEGHNESEHQASLNDLKDLDLGNGHQDQVELEVAEPLKPESPVSEDYLAESPTPDEQYSDELDSSGELEISPEREYVAFSADMRNPDDGTMEKVNYDELTALVYKKWFEGCENKWFRPNFQGERYIHRNHYIYCQIPGYDSRRVRRLGARIIHQPWAPGKSPEHLNSEHAQKVKERRKEVLKNFIDSHLSGGYQLFIGLLGAFLGYQGPFPALEKYFHEECIRSSEREVLEKFRCVVEWAYRAEELFEDVPEIYKICGDVESATFSQQQCAAIVAWMFLTRTSRPNFAQIFVGPDRVHVEKLRFMFTYFEAAQSLTPGGVVSFRRIRAPYGVNILDIRNDFKVRILENDLKIEETTLCTQVDFANSTLGGGVLHNGCVQEEIRFLMCPEMMVSMRLAETMSDRDAISIVGAHVYSSYSGYSWSTKWKPLTQQDARQNDPAKRDNYGRLRVETIAIDALDFKHESPLYSLKQQLTRRNIEREFTKAYIGFSSQGFDFPFPIVSGWWGCGAFCGHKPLKLLIQACAAAKAGRKLWICRFGEDYMTDYASHMFEVISYTNTTPSEIIRMLIDLPEPTEYSETYVFEALGKLINHPTRSPSPQPPASPLPQ